MKKRLFIIIGIILLVLFLIGIATSRYDSARVRSGKEPKYVIKTISEKEDRVTYWGLGYKLVRYVGVSPNEPFENSIGLKYGSWFMKYELEEKIPLEDVKNIIDDYFANKNGEYNNYINSFIDYSKEAVVVYLKDNSKEKQEEFIHYIFSSSTGSKYIQNIKKNSLIKFEKVEEKPEIRTTIAYANWAENDGGLSFASECLNVDKYVFSDFPRLPTFKFDTKAELDEFKNKYKDTFTMDQGYGEIDSFNNVTAAYDDEFFDSHSLMLTYKYASSSSFRYGIGEVKKENDTLIMKVIKTNNPEVYTDDMSGWFLMAEVPKEYIEDCIEFDTQLWN